MCVKWWNDIRSCTAITATEKLPQQKAAEHLNTNRRPHNSKEFCIVGFSSTPFLSSPPSTPFPVHISSLLLSFPSIPFCREGNFRDKNIFFWGGGCCLRYYAYRKWHHVKWCLLDLFLWGEAQIWGTAAPTCPLWIRACIMSPSLLLWGLPLIHLGDRKFFPQISAAKHFLVHSEEKTMHFTI